MFLSCYEYNYLHYFIQSIIIANQDNDPTGYIWTEIWMLDEYRIKSDALLWSLVTKISYFFSRGRLLKAKDSWVQCGTV